MKTFLFPLAACFVGIFAQDINSLPACEQTCYQNLLNEGPNYGCPVTNNGSPAPDCLCSKPEFAYGVRDCAEQSCPSGTDVNQVYQYGLQYCQSAQASASGSATLSAFAIFESGASSTGATSSSSSSLEPISTIPVISTITSDGSTMETTLGSSTIYAGETVSSTSQANATTSSSSTTSTASQTAVTTQPVVSTVSESSTTRETTVGSTTVFSSAASSSSSAGAGATMAVPRLVPRLPGQQTPNDLLWVGRALAYTGFVVLAVQLAWAYGGW